MGLAFILFILGQNDKFRGLNWFESVDIKLAADEENIKKFKPKKQVEETDQELSLRRVAQLRKEFNQLNWGFSAAEILLKDI